MAEITQAAPYIGVRDLRVAAAHYKRLGFQVEQSGDAMALARRDNVTLILLPRINTGVAPQTEVTVWIATDDVSALRDEWNDERVGGETTDVKSNESSGTVSAFIHRDPDGNRLQVSEHEV